VGIVAVAIIICGPVCFVINGRARKKRETIALVRIGDCLALRF
jgi:hypothetical protein